MKVLVDRILLVLLFVVIFAASATAALPAFFGADHLGGALLLAHMFSSGGLVFLLPIFALFWLFSCISSATSGALQRLGFWLLVSSGLLTIATIFACMLPYPSTEQMEQLIKLHGYAGFAMVPALFVLMIGAARWRSIQRARSSTLG